MRNQRYKRERLLTADTKFDPYRERATEALENSTMTPEEIKQANGLIEQIEGLEKVLTLLGSDDIDRISLHRKSSGSHHIDGDTFTKLRAGIEESINRQRLKLMQKLADQYNVSTAA